MVEVKLTEAQAASLKVLAAEAGDGWLLPRWFAEEFGRYDDAAWALGRLKALTAKGLAELSGDRAYYRITTAGRTAIANRDAADEGGRNGEG